LVGVTGSAVDTGAGIGLATRKGRLLPVDDASAGKEMGPVMAETTGAERKHAAAEVTQVASKINNFTLINHK
jgi:hypothetical protein